MAFKFSLATLLRLREIAEQREERLLGQIQNQIVQNRQALVDLAHQRESVIRRREDLLKQSTSIAELQDSYARVKALEAMEESCRNQLAKLVTLCNQQMKIYQNAHRDSELLCEMRDNQKDEFDKERTKQEQNVMDDNFSSRRILK